MGRARATFLVFSIATVLLPEFLTFAVAAQQNSASNPALDWNALMSQVEVVLDKSAPCDDQQRLVEFRQVADVTGDGVPEAFVEYCHMGAYTSDLVLMRLEHSKPVIAQFRDDHGKIVQPGFLKGASVMHGAGTGLLPKEHAVYKFSWDTNSSGGFDKSRCRAQAYVWNASTQTFDYSLNVSKLVTDRECRRLRDELGCGENPCPNKSQ